MAEGPPSLAQRGGREVQPQTLGWTGASDPKSLASGLVDAIATGPASPPSFKGSKNFSFRAFGSGSFRSHTDMAALRLYATDANGTFEAFRAAGGLKKTVIVIRTSAGNPVVLERGCLFLGAMARIAEDVAAELGKSGAHVLSIGALKQGGVDSHRVKAAALNALQNLTSDENNRNEIISKGGVEAIVETISQNDVGSTVAGLGCTVLSNVCFGSEANKAAVGSRGGISAVVKVMKNFREDRTILGRGALALRNIGFKCPETHALAGEEGAIDILVEAMRLHSDDQELVHQSAVALANFTSTNASNRDFLQKAGCVPILVQILQDFGHSSSACEDALTLIRNISAKNESGAREIGEQNGIPLMISVLRAYRDRPSFVEKGTAAFRYVCFVHENRKILGNAGGVEVLTDVLKQSLLGQPAEHAVLALGNAVFRNYENKITAGKCGAIHAVVELARKNMEKEVIAEDVSRVLRCLVDDCQPNILYALESGAVGLGVDVLADYPHNASIQEQAMALLFNIAAVQDGIDCIYQTSTETFVNRAASTHAKHRGVQLHCMLLTARLNGADVRIPPPTETPMSKKSLAEVSEEIVSASGYTAIESSRKRLGRRR